VKRVWVIDDGIPVRELHSDGPIPLRFEADVVRYLVQHVPVDQWGERPVFELCQVLCGDDFEATFFLSPEQMLRALAQGATPPHAVIFDWEYPGSTDERNLEALNRLLSGAFVYVQIYTHLGHDGVEPKVGELRDRFHGRLLPTKGKTEVTPQQLREDIRQAWSNTIAGEVADKVRSETLAAVERTLIDFGEVSKDVLTAMTQGTADNLLHLVLAKVRDEIGDAGFEALHGMFSGSQSAESTEALRRLLSVWYYYFPGDNHVRRGDLIELDQNGELGFVITPPCDLVRFPKKTGRRLTWLRVVRLDANGITTLQTAAINIDSIGGSIIGEHGKAGDTVILLPNVPLRFGNRGSVADYVILCHAWDSRLFAAAPDGSLQYDNIVPFARRCTLADPYASGIVSKIMSVISSPGTPDLPKGERARLKAAAIQPTTPAAPSTTENASATVGLSVQAGPPTAQVEAAVAPPAPVTTPDAVVPDSTVTQTTTGDASPAAVSPSVQARPPVVLVEAADASPAPITTSDAEVPDNTGAPIASDRQDDNKMG
jgi:hypothetical protein